MNIPDEAVEAAIAAVYGESDLPEKLGEFGAEVRMILEAAEPYIERAAVTDELAELAEIMEPFSGKAGLANDATRGEIAKWLRARLASARSTKQSQWPAK